MDYNNDKSVIKFFKELLSTKAYKEVDKFSAIFCEKRTKDELKLGTFAIVHIDKISKKLVFEFFKVVLYDYETLFDELVVIYGFESVLLRYVITLGEIYAPHKETIEALMEDLEDQNMPGIGVSDVMDYFDDLLKDEETFSKIPDYIVKGNINFKNFPIIELSPLNENTSAIEFLAYIKSIDFNSKSNSSANIISTLLMGFNMISDKIKNHEEDIHELYKLFYELRAKNTKDIGLLIHNNLLFKYFGPINPVSRKDYNMIIRKNGSININKLFGGDRMFIDKINWFTGKCQFNECNNVILKYNYAVRRPLVTGGWDGCYCSFQCILEELYKDRVSVMCASTSESTPSKCSLNSSDPKDCEFITEKIFEDNEHFVKVRIVEHFEKFVLEKGIFEVNENNSLVFGDEDEDEDGVGVNLPKIFEVYLETLDKYLKLIENMKTIERERSYDIIYRGEMENTKDERDIEEVIQEMVEVTDDRDIEIETLPDFIYDM